MANRLAGKVAVVTGSTAGIGRACAELFAEEGGQVVVNDNGLKAGLGQQVVESIQAKGGVASYFCADVSKSEQLKQLIAFAVATYGRLDIVMSNAYAAKSSAVLDTEEQDFDAAYTVSLRAGFLVSKYAIPHMIAGGGGSIILTSSVHGLLGGRKGAAYNAMKAGLINLARQMAVDYGRDNIRVNCICPGRILTEAKLVMLAEHPEEVRRQKLVYPLGRPGTMREIANAALFLACDESSFVTGHALVVDGGLTAQLQDSAGSTVDESWMGDH